MSDERCPSISSCRRDRSTDDEIELLNYLPSVLANRGGADVGSINLNFQKLKDGRCLYTYNVKWKEVVDDDRSCYLEEMLRNNRMTNMASALTSELQRAKL